MVKFSSMQPLYLRSQHRNYLIQTTKGNANVLISHDLNAAKIAQQFGGSTAIGPIMQGLKNSAIELSRGCSADDVDYLIALTAVQAQ